MASYVAMVYDPDRKQESLGCDLYCIFSNFDDSEIETADTTQSESTTFEKLLRINGQVSTQIQGSRKEEPQRLIELVRTAYREEVEITLKRIRP